MPQSPSSRILRGHAEHAILVTELARACFIGGIPARAVEVAESVLPTLERLDLTEHIADAMITKGSALGTTGRLREGAAIVRGGLDIAHAYGFGSTEIRARVNLTNYSAYEDPRDALVVGRDGIELAARLGQRSRQRSLLVNVGSMAVATGEWDWMLRMADEVMGRESDDVFGQTGLFLVAQIVFARGTAGGPELASTVALMADLTDANTVVNTLDLEAELDLVEGRFAAAYDKERRGADLDPFSRVPCLWTALEAASWMRDVDRARETLILLRDAGAHGRFIDAVIAGLAAGVAGLEGRRSDALTEFRDAMGAMRALDVSFIVARFAMIAAVTLGPDDPAGAAYADEARDILGSLGAVRWIDRLDETLAALGSTGAAAGRSASADREALEGVG